jgi:hypothetical protein
MLHLVGCTLEIYQMDIHSDGLVRLAGLIRELSKHTHTHTFVPWTGFDAATESSPTEPSICLGSKFQK